MGYGGADAVTERGEMRGGKTGLRSLGKNESAGLKWREKSPTNHSQGTRATETANGLFVFSKSNGL